MLKEIGGRWFVYDRTGEKNVGKKEGFATKEEADQQLKAIEADKARREANNSKQIRVNIQTQINADSIQIERKKNYKNGDDYTIIKNHLWMVDEIVLNNGLYSREDNQAGYQSMEGRLFTAGHPKVNGKYVTISNQDNPISNEALAKHYTGATTINVRNEGNRYYEDIEINERIANASSDGRDLMAWTDKAEAYIAGNGEKPDNLHTSTGLLLNQKEEKGESRGKSYSWVAKNQNYDHNAYLLRENGAGGDEISLSVNSEGDEIDVMTVNLPDIDLNENEQFTDNQKSWITNQIDKFVSKFTHVVKSNTNEQHPETDPMKEKMIAALNAAGVETEGLNDDQLFERYNAMISVNAQQPSFTDEDKQAFKAEILNEIKANAEAEEKSSLVSEIKELKGNTLTEDELNASPLSVLKQIKAQSQPVGNSSPLPAARVNSNSGSLLDMKMEGEA